MKLEELNPVSEAVLDFSAAKDDINNQADELESIARSDGDVYPQIVEIERAMVNGADDNSALQMWLHFMKNYAMLIAKRHNIRISDTAIKMAAKSSMGYSKTEAKLGNLNHLLSK